MFQETICKCLLCKKEETISDFMSYLGWEDFQKRIVDDYSSKDISFSFSPGTYKSEIIVFCRKCYYWLRIRMHSIFLTDQYIVGAIQQRINIPQKILKQESGLIESYRQQIKNRRLIKKLKDENIKTS